MRSGNYQITTVSPHRRHTGSPRAKPSFKRNCPRTDTGVVERRFLLPLPLLVVALAGCGGASTHSESSGSGYRPPPRQHAVLPDSLNIHGCSSTTMGGENLISLCDPLLLKRAWENGTLNERGDLDVRISGRKLRVASTPGLTQVLPDDGIGSLLVPAKVTLEGHASDGSYLHISARSEKLEHVAFGEALFRHLGLGHGGVATIEVKLDDHGAVEFMLRLPDGRTLKPLRVSHLEGPGPSVELPQLPDHYADTPAQGTRTYVAAINARDGTTICQLWTDDVRKRFGDEHTPCWALATGWIDYGSESDSPVFKRVELVDVGTPFERTSRGITFAAVPISLRSHLRESLYSSKQVTRDSRSTVWFRHTSHGWRIAKDPFFTASQDPDAPPGTVAATTPPPSPPAKPSRQELEQAATRAKEERAREARERAASAARQAAAWASTGVDFSSGVACYGHQVHVRDPASDAVVQGTASTASAATKAFRRAAEIRSVSMAIAGRHVCFSVTFGGQPFGIRQRQVSVQVGLGLTYMTKVSVRQAGFNMEKNLVLHNGLTYAGLGSGQPPQPSATHAELRGNTLLVDFDLDSGFPPLVPSQLGNLTWGLGVTVGQYRPGATPTLFFDQVPNDPNAGAPVATPEVRQSDGKTVASG
jgi:hypothetical protein